MRRERGGGGGRGAEKLKGFFYLLLNQLSTMQEIIKGDKKKGGDGALENEGGREGGGKKERRRVNITVLCQANMRCWDTSTKKPPFIWERKRNQETEGESMQERERVRQGAETERKSWEMESESIKQQITSWCHEIGHEVVFSCGIHTYMSVCSLIHLV